MKKILLGLIIGICLPILGGYIFLIAGGLPVATKGPPLPLERFVARTAIHAAMRGETDRPSPVPADEATLVAGAKIYMHNCVACHGVDNSDPTSIAKGLFPKPPQLLKPDESVTDDPVGESFWKVKNGIRMTGMPGFIDSLTEKELWQVSQLLANADKFTSNVLQELHGTPVGH